MSTESVLVRVSALAVLPCDGLRSASELAEAIGTAAGERIGRNVTSDATPSEPLSGVGGSARAISMTAYLRMANTDSQDQALLMGAVNSVLDDLSKVVPYILFELSGPV